MIWARPLLAAPAVALNSCSFYHRPDSQTQTDHSECAQHGKAIHSIACGLLIPEILFALREASWSRPAPSHVLKSGRFPSMTATICFTMLFRVTSLLFCGLAGRSLRTTRILARTS